MKKIITTALAVLVAVYGYGQETLQSVANNGSSTSIKLNLTGGIDIFGGVKIQNAGNLGTSLNLITDWPNTYPTSVLNFWAYYNTTNPLAVIEGGQSNLATNAGIIAFKTMNAGMPPTEHMRITSSGNIGIGISDPSFSSAVTAKAAISQADGSTGLVIGNTTVPRFALNGQSDGSWIMYDYASSTWKQGLSQKSGNVGVGTSNPSNFGAGYQTLAVNGTTGGVLEFQSNGVSGMRLASEPSQSTIYEARNIPVAICTNGVERMRVAANGNVAIGTTNPQGYKLAVAGNVIAESVKVALQGAWPDYVFKADTKLLSLPAVEQFVQQNNHLPEMPSEAEVKKEGIDLGQMDAKLLKKIEELTLYMIDINKTVGELKQKNEALEKEVAQLKARK